MRPADLGLSSARRQEALNALAKGIEQHSTHSGITDTGSQAAQPGGLRLDAIFVPASRPAANLDQALKLARDAGCWLVVLCSGQLRGAEAREYADARSGSYRKVVVVELPDEYSHELLNFPRLRAIRSALPHASNYYTTDLSTKRNVALILARMLKWQRIFFLDDDIRDIAYLDLQHTVDMLGSYSAAGLWITEFPDNSIVCHANRMTGGKQDVFVSGAALAVNCSADMGFFPDVYNEDWLFFFDYASQGKLANSLLEVHQLEYLPFAHAQRAAWQEFGDLVAEGLYSLIHLRLPIESATREYWGHFIEARRTFLERITTRAQAAHPGVPPELLASVSEALKCLLTIQPDLCERYVRAWREDLIDWKARLAGITEKLSIEEALRELGLAPVTSASPAGRTRPRREGAGPSAVAGPVAIPVFDTTREMSERARVHLTVVATDAGRPAADGDEDTSRRRRWFGLRRAKDRSPDADGKWSPGGHSPVSEPLPLEPAPLAGEPALAAAGSPPQYCSPSIR